MKRQFDYTVLPTANALGCNWKNEHIFERWGDDNTVYFTDYVEQTFLSNPLAPVGPTGPVGQLGPTTGANNFPRNEQIVLHVPAGNEFSTFLCEESENVKRTIRLGPGASVKVFVDAWESYQTVPLLVYVSSTANANAKALVHSVHYQWSFYNYSPIGGSPVEGSGVAANVTAELETTPPIIQTLGHTNRTPLGEFPASEESKRKTCFCASERPYLWMQNMDTCADLLVLIKIAI